MSRTPVFRSRRSRWRSLAYLVVIVGAWIGLGLLARQQFGWLLDPLALREFVRGFGVLAPLVFVLLQAAQVVVAPIPGQVLALAAGYLFGPVLGTAVSVVGATIGSYVAFRLSRHYGRSYVERVVRPGVIEEFDAVVAERGLTTLFLVFLVPGLPDDVVCFVAGLTDLDLRKMTAVSFVGRIPGYFLVALSGGELAGGNVLGGVALVALLVAVTVVVYLQRRTVVDWLERR